MLAACIGSRFQRFVMALVVSVVCTDLPLSSVANIACLGSGLSIVGLLALVA